MSNLNHSHGSRLYAAYRKIRFLVKKGSLFSLNRSGERGDCEIPGRTFNIISATSLLFFLIAYLIVYLLYLLITGFTAIVFNIPVILYYFEVDYLIRGIDWTSDSVSGVFSSGPLAMLILSVFLFILYKAVATERGPLRLLVLWMFFHALTRFFGEIIVGAIFGKGFGFVIMYLFFMDTEKVVLTILGFAAMFTTGLLITRLSLYSANIYLNNLLGAYRVKFIIHQFFFPFLAGNIVILLVKIPQCSYFDIALNASMILFLIPILIRSFSIENLYFDQEDRLVKMNMILPLITLFMLLLFRLVLGFGIRL